MKTLCIRVPYAPGIVGSDDAGGEPAGMVFVKLHDGADVERFEEAADAAEGDYAAALLLRRQAELAARLGQPWVDADGEMQWRALQDAEAARVLVVKASLHSQHSAGGGVVGSKARRENSNALVERLDPLLNRAWQMLDVQGRKRKGWSTLKEAAMDSIKADEQLKPLRGLLTETNIENWRKAKGRK